MGDVIFWVVWTAAEGKTERRADAEAAVVGIVYLLIKLNEAGDDASLMAAPGAAR